MLNVRTLVIAIPSYLSQWRNLLRTVQSASWWMVTMPWIGLTLPDTQSMSYTPLVWLHRFFQHCSLMVHYRPHTPGATKCLPDKEVQTPYQIWWEELCIQQPALEIPHSSMFSLLGIEDEVAIPAHFSNQSKWSHIEARRYKDSQLAGQTMALVLFYASISKM